MALLCAPEAEPADDYLTWVIPVVAVLTVGIIVAIIVGICIKKKMCCAKKANISTFETSAGGIDTPEPNEKEQLAEEDTKKDAEPDESVEGDDIIDLRRPQIVLVSQVEDFM